MGNISEIEAMKKWGQIPEEFRKKLLQNVFCGECGVTAIAPGYSITGNPETGIVLTGKCMKCGKEVCRVIED